MDSAAGQHCNRHRPVLQYNERIKFEVAAIEETSPASQSMSPAIHVCIQYMSPCSTSARIDGCHRRRYSVNACRITINITSTAMLFDMDVAGTAIVFNVIDRRQYY
jgi:hypothetical protein